MSKPFIKWVGGKRKLIPQIEAYFPKDKVRRYYEPFVGGGAMFWHLAENERFESATINDWNKELIATYTMVRDRPEELLRLAGLEEGYNALATNEEREAMYKIWRGTSNLSPELIPVRFIFLNKTGFNGLFRMNKKGEFNVPWGQHEKASLYDPDSIAENSRLLQGVTITSGDYADAVKDAGEGDLVYFDPPYIPLTATSNFSNYTSDGFGLAEQKRLVDVATELGKRGAHVVLSNSSSPLVAELYKDCFDVHLIDAARSVNSKGDGRGKIKESLAVYRRT